jgi:hypothetical protein
LSPGAGVRIYRSKSEPRLSGDQNLCRDSRHRLSGRAKLGTFY